MNPDPVQVEIDRQQREQAEKAERQRKRLMCKECGKEPKRPGSAYGALCTQLFKETNERLGYKTPTQLRDERRAARKLQNAN